ncbi:MAG: exo-alpha-sialidase [Thermoguttaceae bacterium]|nr:exo-alpha-sialidase [Thermoguttaceae bacterium]MDW8078844.1 exo-alpha-sialidase [Thermoguttaceae bacterium]
MSISFAVLLFTHPQAFLQGQEPNDGAWWRGNTEAIVLREFVFNEAPFASCHASTIVEGPGGLVCAWFGGTREGASDVGIWLSRHENGRWSPPVEVTSGEQPEGHRFPCWNPVLFRPRNSERLYLFYKVGPSPSRWWGMVTTSDDGGRSWSQPARLPNGILGPIKNKPIELSDGTWVCPSSTETPERPSRWSIHFELTRDRGQTWTRVDVPSGAIAINAIQPTIFVDSRGTLISVGRTREGRLFWTFSADQGQTWAPLQRALLPNPNAGVDGVTLKDGRHLLVFNPSIQGRTPLAVAFSQDAWRWEAALLLEDAPGEFSYPAIIQKSDGLVHITYTWRRQRIAHVVLDPAKLKGVPMPAGQWPKEANLRRELGTQSSVPPSMSPTRPHIVIVITDDQGPGDFSYFGNPILRTPHLDRLFAEGVLLRDFHVTPVCTPTRGQLMTGQDALRNGARTVPAGSNMVWPEIPMLPEVLRQAGYATGLFGKWHLGDHYPNRPMDRGFDKAIWLGGWGIASDVEFDNDTVNTRYLDGTKLCQSQRYCTDLWFDKAIEWMDECRRRGQPFFCYIAPNAPHDPWWAQEKDARPYQDKTKPEVAQYFGMIANIDENIGRLEDFLVTTGLKDDTILVFLTDNGGTAGTIVYNAGLRGRKGGYYEGGHRVPCVIRWPRGGIAGGKVLAEPTQVQDLFPTLLELCGIPKPARCQFDGISLAQALRYPESPSLPERILVVQYGRRTGAVKYDGCVIAGPWRLVNGTELYRIDQDPSQERDLAKLAPPSDEASGMLTKLRSYYEKWWEGVTPRVFEYQPIPVGTEHENPVILSSNYWAGVDVDNNRNVAVAAGGPRGGTFHLQVTRGGLYTIELRRWPFHTDLPIGSAGPTRTVSGRPLSASEVTQPGAGTGLIPKRTVIPARKAILEVAGETISASVTPEEKGAVFTLRLNPGRTTLRGWFQDEKGQDLCGAFYVMIRRDDN